MRIGNSVHCQFSRSVFLHDATYYGLFSGFYYQSINQSIFIDPQHVVHVVVGTLLLAVHKFISVSSLGWWFGIPTRNTYGGFRDIILAKLQKDWLHKLHSWKRGGRQSSVLGITEAQNLESSLPTWHREVLPLQSLAETSVPCVRCCWLPPCHCFHASIYTGHKIITSNLRT